MDRRIDIAISSIAVLFGIFVILEARTIELGLNTDPIGPRAFFFACGAIFILGGLANIAIRVMNWSMFPAHMIPSEGVDDEEGYPASWKRAGLLALLCILYILTFRPLGYLLATPLFIAGALRILAERNWLFTISVGLIFTIVFYIIFAQGLGVWLPVGPFTEFFRSMGWVLL